MNKRNTLSTYLHLLFICLALLLAACSTSPQPTVTEALPVDLPTPEVEPEDLLPEFAFEPSQAALVTSPYFDIQASNFVNPLFNNPYGIATDDSGNVYVLDSGKRLVQKFDSNGTFLTKWGSFGSGDGQFNRPEGIATDANGNVYITDVNNRRVQKFDLNGRFLTKWGSNGSGDGQFGSPEGIAADASGNVYVVDRSNSRVQKFDSNGNFLLKWGSSGSGDGQFNRPEGIATDANGNVYITDVNNRRVQKFDSNGTFLTKWGSSGSGDGQFSNPFGIATDASGNVYVVDRSNSRVQKFDSNGTFLTKWGSNGSGDGQFSFPRGIATDGSGNVYVADTGNRRVQKFDSEGTFLAKWGGNGFADGQFRGPRGIATDGNGSIYVADSFNYRVQKFSSDGTFLTKWGSFGTGDGQLRSPWSIAIDGSGNVYVVDASNRRVQKFDSNGTFLTKWGSSGSGDGQFISPNGIATDSSGNVYVVDGGNNHVQKFSSDGTFLTKWGSFGTGDGQFRSPFGITIDGSGNIYVVDTSNHRVQKFDSNGAFVTKWGTFGSGNGQFGFPSGIATDSSENVYVTDVFHRVQVFSSGGTFITAWGGLGNELGEFNDPYGLIVSPVGTVYVADTFNNRIQVFSPTAPLPCVDCDTTPPVATLVLDPAPNAAGWHNSVPVEVSFASNEAGSCTAASTVSVESADATGSTFSGTCLDEAGNESDAVTATVKVDLTPPVVTLSGPVDGETYLLGSVPTASCETTDALSGVAVPASLDTVGGPIGQVTVSCLSAFDSADNAGNEPSVTFTVIADDTPPVIEVSVTGTQGNNDWYTSDVTVSFSVSDAESEVTSESADCAGATVTTDTSGTTFTCEATSAGGTSTESVTIKLDKTVPVVTASPSVAANAAGWNNTDVTVSYTCDASVAELDASASDLADDVLTASGTAEGTCVDLAGNSASASYTAQIDKVLPVISSSVSPAANANGWYNSAVSVDFSCADADSGVASDSVAAVTLSSDGVNQSVTNSGTCTDAAGNTAQSVTVSGLNIDTTVPVITASPSVAANAAGWNNTDVTVSYSCDASVAELDASASDLSDDVLTASGSAEGTCVDLAGNSATASYTAQIDKQVPVISSSFTNQAWFNSTVNVPFSCVDAGDSGLAVNSVAGLSLSSEGANQTTTSTGECIDNAGNTAEALSISNINIDLTAPIVTATPTPPANAAGWNNTDVTVSFDGTDGLSGIASCDADVVLSSDGTDQSATGSCVDAAGNSASATASGIKIDKTAPVVTASPDRAPNAAGWYSDSVTVSFSATDALSAGVSCDAAVTLGEGGNQEASGSCTDLAGNTGTATSTGINIDLTPPSVTATPSPAANSNGWHNTAVTVAFNGSDSLSGIASCSAAESLSSEGAGQSATGSCTDLAGNSSSGSATNINIDTTVPVMTASPSVAANAAGWNNTDVTVSYSCDASVAELDASASDLSDDVLSASGTATGSCVDLAGNSATASYTAQIDKVLPVISSSVSPAANANGWHNSAVSVDFSCADADSGISTNTIAGLTLSSEGANQSVTNTGQCIDVSGNAAASVTVSGLNIDTTAPVVIASKSASGWTNADVTVSFSATDAVSGVASCDSAVTVSTEGAGQSASGSCLDLAGNSGSATATNIDIDKTAPVVSIQGLSEGATYTLGSVPTATCSTTDALSGVATNASLSTTGATVGAFTATCSGAIDNAGNAGNTATVTYSVVYDFDGFFNPIKSGVNSQKAGSSVPVKFSLGGNQGLDIIDSIVSKEVSCSTGADLGNEEAASSNSGLTYDVSDDQYNYVWKTDKAYKNQCRELVLTLVDGTSHTALFDFK